LLRSTRQVGDLPGDRTGLGRAVSEFEALSRQPKVSLREIKPAFRRLIKQCHPDHGGNPSLFARVYQSYQLAVKGLPEVS
jgi:hypothetical protein